MNKFNSLFGKIVSKYSGRGSFFIRYHGHVHLVCKEGVNHHTQFLHFCVKLVDRSSDKADARDAIHIINLFLYVGVSSGFISLNFGSPGIDVILKRFGEPELRHG